MAKQIKTRKGKDDYYYPYTSPDLVIDNTGKSATTRFEEIEDNQLNLIEDGTTKGIKDTEYDTLTTTDKTVIGSINELSTQFKDIANEIYYDTDILNKCDILNTQENTMGPTVNNPTSFCENSEDGKLLRGYTFNEVPSTNPAFIINGTYRKYPFDTTKLLTIDKSSEVVFLMARLKNSNGDTVETAYTNDTQFKNGIYTDNQSVTEVEIVQILFQTSHISKGEKCWFKNIKIKNRNKTSIKTDIENIKKLKNKIPTIMFNFDETSLDKRYELMIKNGFSATWQYTTNSDKNMLKTLVKNGFDISPYVVGSTGEISDANNIDKYKTAIQEYIDYAESIGVYYPTMYSCAGHANGYALNEALKQFDFKFIRANTFKNQDGTITYTSQPSKYSDVIQFVYPLASHKDFNDVKLKIDEYVNNNYDCLILMCHSFTTDGLTEEYFTNICDYVKHLKDEGRIKVLDAREYYEYRYEFEGKMLDRKRFMNIIINSNN